MDLKSALMGISFAAIWAAAFTATRIVVVAMPPLLALILRFGISAAIAMGLAAALGQTLRLTRAEWRTVIVFGLCQNALYLGLNWTAMQRVEASAAAIIASMMPLMVAFFGWVSGRERLRPRAVAGLVLGVVGVTLIMSVRLRHGLDPIGTLMCVAAVVALVIPSALLEWGRPVHWSPRLAWALGFSILLAGILATFIWFRLVTRIGAVKAAAFHFLSPPFGVAIAALALGERFGWTDVVGSLIVAAGILLVQLARVQPRPAKDRPRP